MRPKSGTDLSPNRSKSAGLFDRPVINLNQLCLRWPMPSARIWLFLGVVLAACAFGYVKSNLMHSEHIFFSPAPPTATPSAQATLVDGQSLLVSRMPTPSSTPTTEATPQEVTKKKTAQAGAASCGDSDSCWERSSRNSIAFRDDDIAFVNSAVGLDPNFTIQIMVISDLILGIASGNSPTECGEMADRMSAIRGRTGHFGIPSSPGSLDTIVRCKTLSLNTCMIRHPGLSDPVWGSCKSLADVYRARR